MNRFEIGRTYETRSIGDYNCIIRIIVCKRTAQTLVTHQGQRLRIKHSDGVEYVKPWGTYSMAPTLRATGLVGNADQ